MDSLQTEDGQFFIRSLAQFIRQHEKALANSLQLTVHRRSGKTNAKVVGTSQNTNTTSNVSTSSLASALSFAGLNFGAASVKAAHLTLTPHHLFYLLSQIEDLGIAVGPMNVRIESIHSDPSTSNYVSFLEAHKPKKGRSDADSIHSVSSVRSVMSGMSAFWSSIGLGPSSAKSEKAKAAAEADLKYLYSAFTKLPSLRLTADHRARLIRGYEEFPFDTAVPLFAFKNVQQLDVVDMDFRQFHGWDRLADQLCLLTVKRGNLDDPMDLLTNIVLDDAERRRRRSTRGATDAPSTPSWSAPSTPKMGYARSQSDAETPNDNAFSSSPEQHDAAREEVVEIPRGKNMYAQQVLAGSVSPKRPVVPRRQTRTYSSRARRTESGSSQSSEYLSTPYRSESAGNLLGASVLPSSKWQRLKYLSLADNGLTSISTFSIAPLTNSLRSFNLSSNLFSEVPDSLSTLSRLTSLDLSNCMIESLQSLSRYPLPAITTLKLKSNRLRSLAGVERLLSLENLQLQDNLLSDPAEAARLTGLPNLRKIWTKHNPFVKNHPDYRIRIMNLFRRTPGYEQDMVIDDEPPSYAERKLLVERTPEVERTSTTVTLPSDPPVVIRQDRWVTGTPAESQTSVVEESASTESSTRRKRLPKRRVVDLAEQAASEEMNDGVHDSPPEAPPPPGDEKPMEKSRPVVSIPRNLSVMSDLDLGTPTSDHDEEVADQSTDDYRARIEALRHEFGSNWLGALGEHQWKAQRFVSETERPSSTLHRANNPVIVSSGRSFG